MNDMRFLNIHGTKTNLSKYIQQVITSHEPITLCKNGTPGAQLIEYKEAQKRTLGLGKNTITISDDFDQLPPELKRYFE